MVPLRGSVAKQPAAYEWTGVQTPAPPPVITAGTVTEAREL